MRHIHALVKFLGSHAKFIEMRLNTNTALKAHQEASLAEKERLIAMFGAQGAEIIIAHLDDLDQSFGSAAAVMRLAMSGKTKSRSAKPNQ